MSTDRDKRFNHASTAIIVLATLGVLYSLYFARDFLIPIAFAILLDFLFSPLVRLLSRLRVPAVVGASAVVVGLMGLLVLGGYQLSGPIKSFVDEAPQSVMKARAQAGKMLQPIERLTENAAKMADVAGAKSTGQEPAKVVLVGPSLASRLADSTQNVLGFMLEVLLLLFFLLAGGDLFLEKTISLLPALQDKKKAVRIARDIESSVSTYLITNLAINVVEGVVLGIALWAIGLPNALLWGTLVVGLAFIPYLGSLIMLGALVLAAFGAFTDMTHILMVPAAYLVTNFIQGSIVSTLVLGRRLALNSVALFIGIAFWFWIWGIPGAFIGVPLMSVLKIYCDHIESLSPIGEFLGARHEPARNEVMPDIVAA
jgi:predicted PurR-regulated permease PerM